MLDALTEEEREKQNAARNLLMSSEILCQNDLSSFFVEHALPCRQAHTVHKHIHSVQLQGKAGI